MERKLLTFFNTFSLAIKLKLWDFLFVAIRVRDDRALLLTEEHMKL